ncbi:orotate phosphoribosyltransferase [Candidatus Bipolaricaulota bacterium]|nr:orotate phosphoribosyltransferase [Candidatus Bipolaricaulota bacterium]
MAPEGSEISLRSQKLAPVLWKSGCLDFGEFTLTSGITSPYYVDLRLLPSYPELFDIATDMAADLVRKREIDFDVVSAVPTGGLPFGTLLAHKLNAPLTYVRKRGKSHGEERQVEGKMEKGDRALVVDDIITTGGSVIEAVRSVRENGGKVDDVLVLLDRTEGGAENLRENGLNLNKVANIEPLVEELETRGEISSKMVGKVKKYLDER